MKDLDNSLVVLALGAVAILAFFISAPTDNEALINLIVGGLLGFLAKAALSPPKP